ncbi:MAG TPA: LemA family protein [Stellaceae bacterium]
MPSTSLTLAVVIGLVLLVAILLYNRLVAYRQRVRNGWAQIDVQLKRRHDLIPNLVASVKGYMAHERGLFDRIAQARSAAIAAGSDVPRRAAAEAELTAGLRSLFAVAEAYPDLKASTNMLALQEELSSTENRIAFARQFFNDAVLAYNTARETFPSSLIATLFGFAPETPFAAAETERALPQVDFGDAVR